MNLVTAIKNVFGLHEISLGLDGVSEPVRAGGDLRATLRLDVRGDPGHFDAVHVHLDEERLLYTAQGHANFEFWRKVAGLAVPLGRLRPGESLHVPLALALPATLEPSAAHRRYRLVARVGALGFGPCADAVVTVGDVEA